MNSNLNINVNINTIYKDIYTRESILSLMQKFSPQEMNGQR